MREANRWVLLLPFISFAIAAWLFVGSEVEARAQFERAKESWRLGRYSEAVEIYRSFLERYQNSEYAPEAIWETASIYYYNLHDINGALRHFESIIAKYPESPWAAKSHLKLAEIYDRELNELSKALEHWNGAVETGALSQEELQEVRFQIADARFKVSEFDLALDEFKRIIEEDEGHLAEQARVRIGTILRIRRQFRDASRVFSEILAETECANCRLQAQLGLIESLEFLNQLPEAIEVARSIDTQVYPSEMRQELLDRLFEKRRYYEPGLWNGL
jgi:tetratricopeptide (TPR) repeat protein